MIFFFPSLLCPTLQEEILPNQSWIEAFYEVGGHKYDPLLGTQQRTIMRSVSQQYTVISLSLPVGIKLIDDNGGGYYYILYMLIAMAMSMATSSARVGIRTSDGSQRSQMSRRVLHQFDLPLRTQRHPECSANQRRLGCCRWIPGHPVDICW